MAFDIESLSIIEIETLLKTLSNVMLLQLLLSGAVVRYYETNWKIHLQSLPENKDKTDRLKEENKLRSRRKRINCTFFSTFHSLIVFLCVYSLFSMIDLYHGHGCLQRAHFMFVLECPLAGVSVNLIVHYGK